MARGKAHAPELKAAVMAALLTGQSSDAVASAYNLPVQTVLDWQRQARLANEVVQSEKKGESNIASLIDRYLVRNLETLSVQAEHFADRSWLSEQPAAEAAVLHGVLVDKAVRILEALESAGRGVDEGGDGETVDPPTGAADAGV